MGLKRSRLLIPGAYVPVADANTITSPWTKKPMRCINTPKNWSKNANAGKVFSRKTDSKECLQTL